MNQLVQNLKTGKMEILEVPFPAIESGYVLVRNYYSVISAGTEGKSVRIARSGYIKKAQEKPKEVKKVIGSIKSKGLSTTYKAVMNQLDMPSPLGYSCAGEIIEVGDGVRDLRVGDFVACAGSTAVHSEVVSVPRNLCVKVPEGVDLKQAAFSTIGAIALQGIRQTELKLGENCIVIGLGLIGQITIQLLNAGGINSIGIDVDKKAVELSRESGAKLSLERNIPDLEQRIMDHTNGYGTDAVIISAGTSALDPVELAGSLCRKKGKVVIVGSVPTGFSREHYYKKELDLRMSCSYGPGRYDNQYEEKGIDYPIGYVRWTENRNMQAFLELLKEGKLNIQNIISHTFKFEDALQAYDIILHKTAPYTGISLEYDISKTVESKKVIIQHPSPLTPHPSPVSVGFIGAGSFAQNFLLPEVKKFGNLIGVATARPTSARNIAEKYKFQYCTGAADEIINDKNINTVFIATRHNLHAEYVIKALKAGKHVYTEKPLCLTEEELNEIKDVYEQQAMGNQPRALFVGFNRRFAPHTLKLKEIFSDNLPKAINYRINAGILPPDHWVHDKEIGGGRIIGEVCHFIDLAMFIVGSRISTVYASEMVTSKNMQDTLTINLTFENGSVASISYFSNGNNTFDKEYLEVFCSGQVVVIDDFKNMTIYSKKKSSVNLTRQNKGHKEQTRKFLTSIKEGLPQSVSFVDIYTTTLASFKIIESIRTKQVTKIP